MVHTGRTRRRLWGSAFLASFIGAGLIPACGGGNGDTTGGNSSTSGGVMLEFGAPCTQDAECQGGFCVFVQGTDQKACSKACTGDVHCLSGWTCDFVKGACACASFPEECNGRDDDCNGVVDDVPSGDPECLPLTNDGCFDYMNFEGMSPVVSFKTDVLPIFRSSCGLSAACHGNQAGPVGQPFLGPSPVDPEPTQADLDAIFAQIVGVASTRAPNVKRVDPGKPQMSFLMHKLDNTLTCADIVCETMGCGASMPLAGQSLPFAQRDIVRRWIAQGAKND